MNKNLNIKYNFIYAESILKLIIKNNENIIFLNKYENIKNKILKLEPSFFVE